MLSRATMFVRSFSYTGILVKPVCMMWLIVSKSRTDLYSIMKTSSSFVITVPTVFFDNSSAPAMILTYHSSCHTRTNFYMLSLCNCISLQGDHSPDNVKFPDNSMTVYGTPEHVKCYSYHAGTSVIISDGGRNAMVHDPKPK